MHLDSPECSGLPRAHQQEESRLRLPNKDVCDLTRQVAALYMAGDLDKLTRQCGANSAAFNQATPLALKVALVRRGLRYQVLRLSWRYAGLAHGKRGVGFLGKATCDRYRLGAGDISQPPKLVQQIVNEGRLLAVLPEDLQEVAMNQVPLLIRPTLGATVIPRIRAPDPTSTDVLGNVMNGTFSSLPMSLDDDLGAVLNT